MRVTDLAGPFEVSLAASSKHVNMLERAELVSRAVAGRDYWLTVDPRPLLDAGGWIDTADGSGTNGSTASTNSCEAVDDP
jgi:hypothetical protein